MKVRWQVDDGYAGGARPQTTTIDISEFDNCETEDQVRDLLDEIIEEEMRTRIGFGIRNEDEVIEEWQKRRQGSA